MNGPRLYLYCLELDLDQRKLRKMMISRPILIFRVEDW
jgi:hypothetical protein